MDPQLDVGKLVGAASAPVALIIATSIFLSNLGGKYAMLVGLFRELSREYRQIEKSAVERRQVLERQMALYSQRIRQLMRATFALCIGLLCFILTVFFTSVSIIFPQSTIWLWITASFSFAGLLILAVSIVLEMIENHTVKRALLLETTGFQHVLDGDGS